MNDQQFNLPEEVTPQAVPKPPAIVTAAPGIVQKRTQRPTEATVIGILMLCFASLAVIGLVAIFIMKLAFYLPLGLSFSNPIVLTSIIVVLVLQISVGIELLHMSPWARMGTIIILVLGVLNKVILSIVSLINLPTFSTQMPVQQESVFRTVWEITIIYSIIYILYNLILCGTMIYFLSRPHVVAAFKAKGGS